MEQQIRVAGRGVAELPIPAWLRVARAWLVFSIFTLVLSAAFFIDGWRWVTDAGADGVSALFALGCAVVVTAAVAAPLLLIRAGTLNSFLNIRKLKTSGRAVFGGFRSSSRPAAIVAVLAATTGATAFFVSRAVVTCPLPDSLAKLRVERAAPGPDAKLLPIYFWDYATWIDPEWLDRVNIVLPYEKGPPQRLLPKIYFEDARTHLILLELHGRRPRSYSPSDVYDLFDAPVAQPRDWPLIWRLEREAGLTSDGLSASVLYLMRIGQRASSDVTQAIGVPWDSIARDDTAAGAQRQALTRGRPENGRMFFWGPDGSVFQVKCPSPCALAPLLETIRFPRDPKGSRTQRLDWTKARLRELLAQAGSANAASPEQLRRENLLSLYLASLLTLDPRDPEAFFHLGKLARNLTTARSAIAYGRDLGLEHVKVLELEGVADRLSP